MAADGIRRRHLRRAARGARVVARASASTWSATPSSTPTRTARLIGGKTKTPTFSLKLEDAGRLRRAARRSWRKHLRAAGADVTLLDRARRRRAQGFRAEGPERARHSLRRGHRSHAADHAEKRRSSPTAIGCSRWTGSTTGRSPTRSLGAVQSRRWHRRGPTPSSSAISVTASSAASTIPGVDRPACRQGPLRVADSQVASRWGNILDFQGFDLITPNEREARFALGDQDSTIRPLALELYKQAACKTLILKMGERGHHHLSRAQPRACARSSRSTASPDSVVDAVGAGDALLAYATLASLRPAVAVIASDPRLDGGGCRLRARRQHPGRRRRRCWTRSEAVEKRIQFE